VKLGRALTLDRLSSERQCLGAAFCTYTFDPAFFEEQVLRTVLRLGSDPDEQPARFLDEARAAIVETPVVCVVDADVRQAGRRVPYDLLEVDRRVFHPKLVVLLYEECARVLIGSGNLTRGGFGGNTEFFFQRDLRYSQPDDAVALRDVDRFLARAGDLARTRGSQLARIRELLDVRLRDTPPPANGARSFAIIDTEQRPLIEQLLAVMPAEARVTRIGLLAPFFEQDDGDGDVSSVLGTLLGARPSAGATIDVAVVWDDPAAVTPPGRPLVLDEHLGRLWSWQAEDDGGRPTLRWLTPQSIGASVVQALDDGGQARRIPRDECESAIARNRAWPLERPRAFAPARKLESAAEGAGSFTLWLHPAWRFEEGLRVHRPLHAKLLTITARQRGRIHTWILVGSANASQGALLRSQAKKGNVELGVLLVLEGEHSLKDLCPELVACDRHGVELMEREFPAGRPDLARWIESASYDAAVSTLTIRWASEGSAPLGEWALRYLDQTLLAGKGAPAEPSTIDPFTLSPSSAELTLVVGAESFSVPVLVRDLAALPPSAGLTGLGLRELLALLGRRIGGERLSTLRVERGAATTETAVDAIFGEGFGPPDVFRAWWAIAEDLASPNLSVQGVRQRLAGALGAGAVWQAMENANLDGSLSREELWFYGVELLSSLRAVRWPATPDAPLRQRELDEFVTRLRGRIDAVSPETSRRPWVQRIKKFYEVGT
jgi:hypothetical protein